MFQFPMHRFFSNWWLTFVSKRTYCYSKLYTEKNIPHASGGMFSQDPSCLYCKGTKILICLECQGGGRTYQDGMKEFICNGCRGCGYNTCNFCGGTGFNCML